MCMVYGLVVYAIDCRRGTVGCVEGDDEVDYLRWRTSLSTSSELGGDTILYHLWLQPPSTSISILRI